MPTIYRSARGKIVDMDMIRTVNETTVAVGNVRVNARGDQLDDHGRVIRTRDEEMASHYRRDTQRVATPSDIVADAEEALAQQANSLEADVLDPIKLKEAIDQLTAETPEPEPLKPNQCRGGLAAAVKKQQEQKKQDNGGI